jgi:hypothetical protein
VQRVPVVCCQAGMKQLILLCGLIFFNASCKRNSCCALPVPEMMRIQTQCSDPWGYGNNEAGTIDKLKHYLAAKNILPDRIELQNTGQLNTCAACNCSKGSAFHVWAEPRYTDSLVKEGFVIK